MDRALKRWHESQAVDDRFQNVSFEHSLRKSYTIYGDMLLLSSGLSNDTDWQRLSLCQDKLQALLHAICQCLKVSRIAINRPIPLDLGPDRCPASNENVLRSPVNFEPLCGDFGPSTAASPPLTEDFEAAYWVTARQNGIAQTWAPRWTMFSRGNITEKARILKLESVQKVTATGPCSAVDLYAGIGYFAFSYARAGFAKVLCWELNAWSCEGLRRGAQSNRWTHGTAEHFDQVSLAKLASGLEQLLVFQESNEHALHRLKLMADLPPVRHVNCGLLPTSRQSWPIAFAAISPQLGGWIHVHENFALLEIKVKAEEVRQEFQRMLAAVDDSSSVTLESINRVKSYAPGVWHCVLDIFISPRETG